MNYLLWHCIVAVVIFEGVFISVVELYNMHQVYISVLSNLFGIVCKCFIRSCCIDQRLSEVLTFFFFYKIIILCI
jgi:hypothetical protein